MVVQRFRKVLRHGTGSLCRIQNQKSMVDVTKFDVSRCQDYPFLFARILKLLSCSGIITADEPILSGYDGYMVKIQKHIENYIRRNHAYAICKRSDGRYQTKISSDGRSITGKTIEELYMKLYLHYHGKNTLESLYPRWIAGKEKNCADKSADIYRQRWNKYLAGTEFSRIEVENLTSKDWVRFSKNLVGNMQMKAKLYADIKIVVNGTLEYAVLEDIIPSNPIAGLKAKQMGLRFAPDEKDREEDFYSVEECRQLLDYLFGYVMTQHDDNHYALASIIQIHLGIRIGELKAIHIEDIDFEDMSVFIHRSIVQRKDSYGKNRNIEKKYTKGKDKRANRTIPIADKAMDAIRGLIEYNMSILGDKYNGEGEDRLFVSLNGTIIATNHFNEHFDKYCRAAGLGHHTSHDNRRFAISELFEQGLPEVVIQYYAGHLCASTTRSYYRQIEKKRTNELIRDALNKI